MTEALIAAGVLAVWLIAIRHLRNPANLAGAMPPPPSLFSRHARTMARAFRGLELAFGAALLPAVRKAVAAAAEFQVQMARAQLAASRAALTRHELELRLRRLWTEAK